MVRSGEFPVPPLTDFFRRYSPQGLPRLDTLRQLDPHAILLLGIPQTAAAMIVPAGFALIALQLLLRTVEGAAGAVRGPRGSD